MDSADAFIAIYSIVSQRSFDIAAELCLKLESKFPEVPVLLLANCCDLNYAREVDAEEGNLSDTELTSNVRLIA